MKGLKIIWSHQAKSAVKDIFEFIKKYSLEGAQNVKRDLISSPLAIKYPNQYQKDNINPKYRRIIIRGYKVLYRERNGVIEILDVVCTLRSPEILKNK